MTRGVKTLLGDPKKAVLKLATPMIVAMFVNTIYNVADAIWVSGLGPNALAAVTYFFPILILGMALANGLGIGGGSAISRYIGAGKQESADSAATHTIVLMFLVSALFMGVLLLFGRFYFIVMGAGDALAMTLNYTVVMAIGSLPFFFNQIGTALLRAEGDANRAMAALIIGAGLNIFLDPVFIYWFGLGVAGAAVATIISISVSSLFLLYWLFIKNITYVRVRLKKFRFRSDIMMNILQVGIPGMLNQASISGMFVAVTFIVNIIAGNHGVAVYGTGWRVVSMAILPTIGIATAVVSISGATFGAREFGKLDTAYIYAVKFGLIIETTIAIATFLAAPGIAMAFTWAEASQVLRGDLTRMLRLIWIFYPSVAFGMLSASMFQGTGKGLRALLVTLFRTVGLIIPLTAFFGIGLDRGLPGVWWGIIIASWIVSMGAFFWARHYIHCMAGSDTIYAAENTSL